MPGYRDLLYVANRRMGHTVIRRPLNVAVRSDSLTITSRRCLVMHGEKVVREVVSDTWTIEAGQFDTVLIVPIEETRVSGFSVSEAGSIYQRFIANKNGTPLRHVVVADTDFGANGQVELLRIDNMIVNYESVFDPNTTEPLALTDGVDVNHEWKKTARWYTTDFTSIPVVEAYFLMFVINIKPYEDDLNCRLYVRWGTGTETSPVVKGSMVTWLAGGCCGCMTEIVLGVEQVSQVNVVSFGLMYPPYYGVSAMPFGSFQVYGIPLRQICTINAVQQDAQYQALKSAKGSIEGGAP